MLRSPKEDAEMITYRKRPLKERKDMRNTVVKRRRSRALDRIRWASVVREANAKLKGL
jgi:hypothetical protein